MASPTYWIVRLKSWYIYGNTGDACGNSVPHNRSLRMGCASLIDGVIILLSAGFLYPDFAWRCAMKAVRHGIEVEEQRRCATNVDS